MDGELDDNYSGFRGMSPQVKRREETRSHESRLTLRMA